MVILMDPAVTQLIEKSRFDTLPDSVVLNHISSSLMNRGHVLDPSNSEKVKVWTEIPPKSVVSTFRAFFRTGNLIRATIYTGLTKGVKNGTASTKSGLHSILIDQSSELRIIGSHESPMLLRETHRDVDGPRMRRELLDV